jgi:hypothetical protein
VRVGEGGGTCKKIILAWLDGQHHERLRRGASVAFPLGSKARASTKGRGKLVLTLVSVLICVLQPLVCSCLLTLFREKSRSGVLHRLRGVLKMRSTSKKPVEDEDGVASF